MNSSPVVEELAMKSRMAAVILCSIAYFCPIDHGMAETLKVIVQDQNNTGVPSDVYVYKASTSDEANRLITGETNEQGIYVENHKCETTQIIKARPKSSGEYFESKIKPCKQEVAITVIRRDTPKGYAFNGNVIDVTLPDGSLWLIATWAFIDTSKAEKKLPAQTGTTCDVSVLPRLDHMVYKVTGDKLVPFSASETKSSQVLTYLKTSEQFSAIFPSSCTEAKNKILVLENSLAAKIDSAINSESFSAAKMVQIQNLQ